METKIVACSTDIRYAMGRPFTYSQGQFEIDDSDFLPRAPINLIYSEDGTSETWELSLLSRFNEHNWIVKHSGERITDGFVFWRPAYMLLDDGQLTNDYMLPYDEPTWVKIDVEKSKRVPSAVRSFFCGTCEYAYIYAPDESGRFTIGGWIEGMRVKKNPSPINPTRSEYLIMRYRMLRRKVRMSFPMPTRPNHHLSVWW